MAKYRKFTPLLRDLPIEYDYGRAFNPVDRSLGFVGSHHQDLIKKIIAITCPECKRLLIDCEGSPMTGFCSHIFCFDCAVELFIKERKSINEKQLRRTKEFDSYIDSNTVFYKCKVCDHDYRNTMNKYYMRIFSENVMIKDIYDALKQSGFTCRSCELEDESDDNRNSMHPLHNSLHCKPCSIRLMKNIYNCVWHASKHMAVPHSTLSIIHPDFIGMNFTGVQLSPVLPKKAPLNRLVSLDRSSRKEFAALYHCACCSTPLEKDTATLIFHVHSHLECGHFIGARCMETLENMSDNEKEKGKNTRGIYCIFCNKNVGYKENVKIFTPRSRQLAGIVLEPPNNSLYKCNNGCRWTCEFRPCESLTTDKDGCPFCKVEHYLIEDCPEKKKK